MVVRNPYSFPLVTSLLSFRTFISVFSLRLKRRMCSLSVTQFPTSGQRSTIQCSRYTIRPLSRTSYLSCCAGVEFSKVFSSWWRISNATLLSRKSIPMRRTARLEKNFGVGRNGHDGEQQGDCEQCGDHSFHWFIPSFLFMMLFKMLLKSLTQSVRAISTAYSQLTS